MPALTGWKPVLLSLPAGLESGIERHAAAYKNGASLARGRRGWLEPVTDGVEPAQGLRSRKKPWLVAAVLVTLYSPPITVGEVATFVKLSSNRPPKLGLPCSWKPG